MLYIYQNYFQFRFYFCFKINDFLILFTIDYLILFFKVIYLFNFIYLILEKKERAFYLVIQNCVF